MTLEGTFIFDKKRKTLKTTCIIDKALSNVFDQSEDNDSDRLPMNDKK